LHNAAKRGLTVMSFHLELLWIKLCNGL
jgi:hypothetical protein